MNADPSPSERVNRPKGSLRILLPALFTTLAIIIGTLWLQKKEAPKGAAPDNAKVRIGYRAIASNIPFFVAIEQGYFAKHGLAVEPVRFETADAGMDALMRGDIAADFATPLMVFLTREAQLPGTLKVFGFQMDTPTNSHEGLVVATNSTTRAITDLRGKLIATYPGVAAKVYFEECLRKAGFLDADINLKPLQASMHIQALRSGQVEALFTYEPVLALSRHEGWGRTIEAALFPRYLQNPTPVTVFPILGSFADKYPQTARNIVAAIGDAIEYIGKNEGPANQALVKYTTLKDVSVAVTVGQMRSVLVKEADLSQVQAFADWHVRRQLVKSKVVMRDVLFPAPQ